MRKVVLILVCAGVALAASADAQMPPDHPMGPRQGGALIGAMREADTNHDHVITRDEFKANAARRFAQMDTNGDGHVSTSERDSYRATMRDRRIADGGGAPPPSPPPPHEMHDVHDGGIRPARHGPVADRDMTRDDFMARAGERFDRMDVNHDGKLDPADMMAMRGMRHGRGDDRAPPPPPPPAPPAGAQ